MRVLYCVAEPRKMQMLIFEKRNFSNKLQFMRSIISQTSTILRRLNVADIGLDRYRLFYRDITSFINTLKKYASIHLQENIRPFLFDCLAHTNVVSYWFGMNSDIICAWRLPFHKNDQLAICDWIHNFNFKSPRIAHIWTIECGEFDSQ